MQAVDSDPVIISLARTDRRPVTSSPIPDCRALRIDKVLCDVPLSRCITSFPLHNVWSVVSCIQRNVQRCHMAQNYIVVLV